MESHRVFNTMETTSIPILSLKSHITNIKRLNDKRILVQEKAFMHQYIMQLHTISFKKEMAAPLTWFPWLKFLNYCEFSLDPQ